MNEKEILQVYQALDIKVVPVTPNYNPDTFGKSLMANIDNRVGVSYSASTEYSLKAESKRND